MKDFFNLSRSINEMKMRQFENFNSKIFIQTASAFEKNNSRRVRYFNAAEEESVLELSVLVKEYRGARY